MSARRFACFAFKATSWTVTTEQTRSDGEIGTDEAQRSRFVRSVGDKFVVVVVVVAVFVLVFVSVFVHVFEPTYWKLKIYTPKA